MAAFEKIIRLEERLDFAVEDVANELVSPAFNPEQLSKRYSFRDISKDVLIES